ncbi:translation initiation factor IF-2-like [Elephas maximus indicus]|uniref:translation initiation factor IF-2-like n=1 Tax=Elephas maximus indicus TaxID=99487 RepID=UPI002116B57A|nr:translation initiation factor IF-2-like [Elephas maximus indicus]
MVRPSLKQGGMCFLPADAFDSSANTTKGHIKVGTASHHVQRSGESGDGRKEKQVSLTRNRLVTFKEPERNQQARAAQRAPRGTPRGRRPSRLPEDSSSVSAAGAGARRPGTWSPLPGSLYPGAALTVCLELCTAYASARAASTAPAAPRTPPPERPGREGRAATSFRGGGTGTVRQRVRPAGQGRPGGAGCHRVLPSVAGGASGREWGARAASGPRAALGALCKSRFSSWPPNCALPRPRSGQRTGDRSPSVHRGPLSFGAQGPAFRGGGWTGVRKGSVCLLHFGGPRPRRNGVSAFPPPHPWPPRVVRADTPVWPCDRVTLLPLELREQVHLTQAVIFSNIASYACESWTVKKEDRKIDAFILWCWQRILKTSWTARMKKISLKRNTTRMFLRSEDGGTWAHLLRTHHQEDPSAEKAITFGRGLAITWETLNEMD